MDLPVNQPTLPMLAKAVGQLPVGGTWIFEPKWDGFRALVIRDGEEIATKNR
jgi:ATP-dependent DNA ligase